MKYWFSQDRLLGLITVAVGLISILVWVPLDTGSGIVEKYRGKWVIGDAFAPTVAFAMLAFSGLLLLLETLRREQKVMVARRHVLFVLFVMGVFFLSFAAMRWTGPLAVWLAGPGGPDAIGYRELRDTAPWKYLGFLTGGGLLVGAFISIASGRVRPWHLAVGVLAALGMILLYDLPFDDLLLPPNGDV